MAQVGRFLLGVAVLQFNALVSVSARKVVDKTPTPCKDKYDDSFISSTAEKYVAGFPVNENPPRLLLLLGGSGAGKGTFVRHLEKHGFSAASFVKHGLDDYIELLPEWQQTKNDPDNVYKDGADSCYGGGAIPLAKAVQKIMLERKISAIYEETGKDLNRILTRVLPPFVDAGYEVSVVLVDNSEEIATSRARGRFQKQGRYADSEYIAGTFKGVFPNYLTLKTKPFVKEAVYCDNSCKGTGFGFDWDPPADCLRCWIDQSHQSGESSENSAGGPVAAVLKWWSGGKSTFLRNAFPAEAFLKGNPAYADHQGTLRKSEL